MATSGTLATGIYQKSLTEFEVRLPADQDIVMQGIAGVKAGDLEGARLLLERVADDLFRDQCDAIIMACTEIPLGLAQRAKRAPAQYIDPTNALAKMSVARWSKRLEPATEREDKKQYARA
jgi:aspartate racemase